MNTVMQTIVGACFVVLGLLGTFFVSWLVLALLGGWVLSCMWGWFMVPIFDLPALTVIQAIGVTMVAGLFTVRFPTGKPKSDIPLTESLGYLVTYQFVTLGLGYIVHLFL